MRELLEGRALGFALRAPIAGVAAGLGLGATLLDLMSWSAWGTRDTNALVVGAHWLVVAVAVVALLGLVTALAEIADLPDEDRQLGRTDLAGVAAAVVLYAASAVLRATDPGAAAASPLALLTAAAGLVLLLVGAALASALYASREWEEV